MLYAIAGPFNVYVADGRVTIFDTRVTRHRPVFLKGDDADAFILEADTLALNVPDDGSYNKKLEEVCAKWQSDKAPSII